MVVSTTDELALVLISEGINFPNERAMRMIKRLRENGLEVTAISNPNVDDGEVQRMIQDEI